MEVEVEGGGGVFVSGVDVLACCDVLLGDGNAGGGALGCVGGICGAGTDGTGGAGDSSGDGVWGPEEPRKSSLSNELFFFVAGIEN